METISKKPFRPSAKCSHCDRNPSHLNGNEVFLIGQMCPHCKEGRFIKTSIPDTRKPSTNQGALWGFTKRS
jgi:hypothetical protein